MPRWMVVDWLRAPFLNLADQEEGAAHARRVVIVPPAEPHRRRSKATKKITTAARMANPATTQITSAAPGPVISDASTSYPFAANRWCQGSPP